MSGTFEVRTVIHSGSVCHLVHDGSRNGWRAVYWYHRQVLHVMMSKNYREKLTLS